MFTLSLFFLLGVCGLAIDIGRMYITKSEAQSFVDAAALNAAVSLASKPGVFTAATGAAANTAKQWGFGNNTFTNVVTTFGTSPTDPNFTATPPYGLYQASDYTFAQVTARVDLPLYLMRAVVRSNTSSIAASAMSGQMAVTSVLGGEFPFSPYSRKTHNPDNSSNPYGYKIGNWYTMRWSPPGNQTNCGTDMGNVGQNGSFRGYCCTGSSSAVSVRDVLAGGGTVPLNVGDALPIPPGQKNTIDITSFIDEDTDTTSATYAAYVANGKGNGKRLIVMAVNEGATTVVGFAAFFLGPADQYSDKNYCAEYIGSYVQNLPALPSGTGSGVYRLKLFQ